MSIFEGVFPWVKKHKGQPAIAADEGDVKASSERRYYFENAYDNIEVVRRGVDILVDSASQIDIDITEPLNGMVPRHTEEDDQGRIKARRLQKKTLLRLLNHEPNPNEDISVFRRQLYTDLILTGNVYQYFDGQFLYNLPAKLMEVKTGKKRKVDYYKYQPQGSMGGATRFDINEILHTRDNSSTSVYVGTSRLKSASTSIRVHQKMLTFQENFFEHGAVPGLILTTENILGQQIKEKLLRDWKKTYNPLKGGKSPVILDGGFKVNPLSVSNFKELDFANSVSEHEKKILKALGVPPILLEAGNNANIRPNLQLFYETTVLSMVAKVISSYEAFFAYDCEPDVLKVRALRPELRDEATYLQSLVNVGIITPNEARARIRLEPSTEEHADKLRIPANIAGSAANPSEGGRPEEDNGEGVNEE